MTVVLTDYRYHGIRSDVRASTYFYLPNDINSETVQQLDDIASAYRNVLVAYLHIILDGVEEHQAIGAGLLECHQLRSLLPLAKDEAISRSIRDILCVPEDSPSAVGMVPLLFVVASLTKDLDEFNIVFGRLAALDESARLGQIHTACELLERIRPAIPSDWRQVVKDRKWDLIIS